MTIAPESLAALAAERPWPLRSNAPLLLDAGPRAWLLTAGRAQVFALPVVDGVARGRRTPLVTLEQGSLVPAPPAGAPLGLLLVGLDEDTEVVEVDVAPVAAAVAQGAREGASPEAAARAARAVAALERWIDALAAACDEHAPDAGHPLHAGLPAELHAGDAAFPEDGTLWLDGRGLALAGSEALPAGALVPVAEQAWVEAGEALSVTPLGGLEALARPEGWTGLDAAAGALLALLARRLHSEGEQAVERLARRVEHDGELLEEAFTGLGSVLGTRRAQAVVDAEGDALIGAFMLVGEALGIEVEEPPPGSLGGVTEPVEAIARASGVRIRQVALGQRWWRQDLGPLIGVLKETGRPVALLQRRTGGYELVDAEDGTRARVTAAVAAQLEPAATTIYRPLHDGPVGGRDILAFVVRGIRRDLWRLALAGLGAGALSLVVPLVTDRIFGTVVPDLDRGALIWLTALVAVLTVGGFGLSVAQQIAAMRIEARAAVDLQAALWDRVLDLPLDFFRRIPAGTLAVRVTSIEKIRSLATTSVASAALGLPIGLFSMGVAFWLQPRLALFSLVPLLLVLGIVVWLVRWQFRRGVEVDDAAYGTGLELVQAIAKLRVAAAEQRAFVRWVRDFRHEKRGEYEIELGVSVMTSIIAAVPALATMVVVLAGVSLPEGAISPARFIAFNAALVQALGAFAGLTAVATFLSETALLYDDTHEVLEEPREREGIRSDPGELRGAIEVAHVSLRYRPDEPLVLDDVSFEVQPGEFVAVVGPSGAGKSSLLRVLLGFERLDLGTVRYDGRRLDTLDLSAVRRQIGVVVQSARLMPGDIYTNIVGPRPLAMADAWEAARVAGIEDEIRRLPMGMQTRVGDGGGTFSGGQRQRLLIARAVAGRPRILLFDEATSALDNRSQAAVADTIHRLRATRVVIAHRLSTVRKADRILVLDQGRIVQEGSFDELMAQDGLFRDLARRQLA